MRSPRSNHLFSRVPSVQIPRSAFKRDRTYKTCFNSGVLVPFFLDEVLPGDTFNLNVTAFARLATPVVPFMDNLYLDYQFFFCPCRLVWENWERFNGAQDNPDDSTDFLVPQVNTPANVGWAVGSIGDYFGLPVGVSGLSVNALPFRAYNLIWNEFYRDENLQESEDVMIDDGPDLSSSYDLLPRGKRKDYFTSCLPWPQKGPGVEIPLGGLAPVKAVDSPTAAQLVTPVFYNASTAAKITAGYQLGTMSTAGVNQGSLGAVTSGSINPTLKLATALAADLSAASAITINTMRQAFQLQRLYERDARSGTRYFELLVAHFGVRSPDSRLQRPEYLGGGVTPVQIHTVTQTSSTDETSPQGNLAAVGVSAGSRIGFSKSFVEHGYIIGLVSVRADLTYQQGLDRMWSRRSRFDFYWPALAHLGEQAVLSKEIYCDGSDNDELVFGYQERWAEYRYGISKITGKLRSGVSGSLDVWHLAEHFANRPTLSAQFIESKPPISRVVAVQNEPEFVFDCLISCNCVRPMPVYSVPGLIDHF